MFGRLIGRLAGCAAPRALYRRPETQLSLEQTATDRLHQMPVRTIYDYRGDFIDPADGDLAECPTVDRMIELGIPGWLLPANALKLCELIRVCGGDVLDLGNYRGLSATVALQASVAAGLTNAILSIDLDAAGGGNGDCRGPAGTGPRPSLQHRRRRGAHQHCLQSGGSVSASSTTRTTTSTSAAPAACCPT